MESLKKKRLVRVSDIDIFKAIQECENPTRVIRKLKLDKSGKSYKRVKAIKEKYNLNYKDGQVSNKPVDLPDTLSV